MARVNYDDYLKRVNNKIQPGLSGGEVNPTINPLPQSNSYLDEYDARENGNYVETPQSVATPQSVTTPKINSAYDYKKYMASQGQNVDLTPNKNIGSQPDNLQSYLEEYDKREGIDEPITPTTKPTTPETNNGVDTKTMWDKQRMQLAQSAVNQKAELDAINQKANSYVNAYMKALGLSGTSAGASQIAENSLNLANAYSQVNANEQQALNDMRGTNSDALTAIYQAALENDASNKTLNEILSSYDDDSVTAGTKDLLSNYAKAVGNTWENDRDLTKQDMQSQLVENADDLTENQKSQISQIANQLNNAKDNKEYYEIYEKYKDVIQDVTKASDTAIDDVTNNEDTTDNVALNDYKGDYQLTNKDLYYSRIDKTTKALPAKTVKESDFGDFNGTGEKGDTQYIWANMIINLAKKGQIPENSAIDMNVGAGSSAVYYYRNGEFVKGGSLLPTKNNVAIAKNSLSSIKEQLKKLTNKDYSAEVDNMAKEK